MTMKAAKNITLGALLVALLIPVLSGIITHQVNLSTDQKAQEIKCLNDRTLKNERDIMIIQEKMPSIEQIDKLMEDRNNELIRMLFEKGYIRRSGK